MIQNRCLMGRYKDDILSIQKLDVTNSMDQIYSYETNSNLLSKDI
jgi:hypothetical protein